MSDRIYSLEELIELIPELAEANDVAFYPVDEQPRTRVVHVNDNVDGAVYIGRANGRKRLRSSMFHSPYWIGLNGSRAEAVAKFREYALECLGDPWPIDEVIALRGKPLACWCRHDGEPKTPGNACHGDVLVDLLERYSDDELRAMAKGTGDAPAAD